METKKLVLLCLFVLTHSVFAQEPSGRFHPSMPTPIDFDAPDGINLSQAAIPEIGAATTVSAGAAGEAASKAQLNGAGADETLLWWAEDDWQRITYNLNVSFDLDVVFLEEQGDVIRYSIVAQEGSVHFWGVAEDYLIGAYDVYEFDIQKSYTEVWDSGILEYDRVRQCVVYADFSLAADSGDVTPYRIEYFGLAHPHSVRLWVQMPIKWLFDEAYDSCRGPIAADFSHSQIVAPHIDVSYNPDLFQYNSFYGGSWFTPALGAYVEGEFQVDELPASAELVLQHLTSANAACSGDGYAPVDIMVNGSTVASCYDPAAAHDGTHGYVTDRWEIAPQLHTGTNNWRVALCDTVCSPYWLKYLYIDDLGDDCATCVLDVPKLFALVIGVNDDPNKPNGKIGQLDAEDIYNRLSSVPSSANLLWANADYGNPQAPIVLWSHTPSDANNLIADTLDAMDIRPLDTFVFYISSHGGTPKQTDDERNVIIDGFPNDDGEALWTGTYWVGEKKHHESISDDFLPGLFLGSKWGSVKKIFMIQACRAGGFAGDSPDDDGDLDILKNWLLLAASTESANSVNGLIPLPSGGYTPRRGVWTFFLSRVLWQYDWEELWHHILDYKGQLLGDHAGELWAADDFYSPGELIPFEFDPVFIASDDFDTASGLGGVTSGTPMCDFNNDEIVDLRDMALLGSYWLEDEPFFDIAPPPFGDHIVNLRDFGCLADHWLESTLP